MVKLKLRHFFLFFFFFILWCSRSINTVRLENCFVYEFASSQRNVDFNQKWIKNFIKWSSKCIRPFFCLFVALDKRPIVYLIFFNQFSQCGKMNVNAIMYVNLIVNRNVFGRCGKSEHRNRHRAIMKNFLNKYAKIITTFDGFYDDCWACFCKIETFMFVWVWLYIAREVWDPLLYFFFFHIEDIFCDDCWEVRILFLLLLFSFFFL